MPLYQELVTLQTREPIEFADITPLVKAFVVRAPFREGLLNIMSSHTTLGVAVNEVCPQLQGDMDRFLKRLVPPDADYAHNRVASDGRPNARSHLLSLLVPTTVTIPVTQGELGLGSWQAIFAIELDGPRSERNLTLTLVGA